MTINRKTNFERICTECSFHEQRGEFHRCHAARDPVNGRVVVSDCRFARSVSGYCGPEGTRHSAVDVVVPIIKAAKPK